MLADALRAHPTGFDEALALVDGVDDVLVHGLARIDEERAAALESLAAAFAGSPLADPVTDSVGKIIAGTVTDEHLATLAGARTGLLGAAHDALVAGVDAALGRAREPWSATAVPADPGHLSAGVRSWLRELAIAGWRGVDHELAGGGAQTVQALLADPSARRLAVVLTREAGRTFPGTLAGIDSWTAPWDARRCAPARAGTTGARPGPGAGGALLAAYPAATDAVASLLGCTGQWYAVDVVAEPVGGGADAVAAAALLAAYPAAMESAGRHRP